MNFAELERVVSSQEKTSKYHTSGLEREQIRQNYEDLRDILAAIQRIYNETKNFETTENGVMSLRSFRLIEELQRMFNETKSSQMPENLKEKSDEKKYPTLDKSKVMAKFRILSNSVLGYLVAYLLYHLHAPIFSFLLYFS